jgi:hypothetical protein
VAVVIMVARAKNDTPLAAAPLPTLWGDRLVGGYVVPFRVGDFGPED